MQELDHLNIVRYIECIKQEGTLHIVMEYCRYGDLSGLIANRAQAAKPFTEQEIMFWFVQITLALWQLHGKGILHRDLKSQNIFIAEGAIAKLGDFGISRVLSSETELVKTAIGTPYYLSPEICQDKPYNRKTDCWALGCVLYELASLRRAFDGGSLPALVVKILRGRYPPLPGRYSAQLRGLVGALLQQDPQARPSIDTILRMPYVKTHLAKYAQHVMRICQAGPELPSQAAAAAVAAGESAAGALALEEAGAAAGADADGDEQTLDGSMTSGSEDEAGSDDGAGSSGTSPDGQQCRQQRRGLLATGWLERQQAAFDQLQAEMAALPARSPGISEQPVGAPRSAPAAADAADGAEEAVRRERAAWKKQQAREAAEEAARRNLPQTSRGGSHAKAAGAKALRCSLEESLGQEAMMMAYRYVEAMQQASEADQATEIGADSSAAGSSKGSGSHVYEKLLAELLGARSPHVLHQMNKLLLLESQAFGR
ncbi:hypothetical protein OEZ85_011398 [Tetradesmus obliquus]|uniref:non-specific serine/threonine protein kinase n=1 Tax=Tetradesmus obliquus TaxID=3088 RepID=A0ABY8TQ83_TETOB|nr:hypothetical protein OEZ85_011398 [Tetradesmus obliquus]